MRKKLRKLGKKTHRFVAKYNMNIDSDAARNALITKIYCKSNNMIVSNHMWVNLSGRCKEPLQKGDIFSFTGRVAKYYKGKGKYKKMDFTIVSIKKILKESEAKDVY